MCLKWKYIRDVFRTLSNIYYGAICWKPLRDHSFSTCPKIFKKLTFLTPWHTYTCAYQGVWNVGFSENFAYAPIEGPLTIFAKSFILDFWLGSAYAFVYELHFFRICKVIYKFFFDDFFICFNFLLKCVKKIDN